MLADTRPLHMYSPSQVNSGWWYGGGLSTSSSRPFRDCRSFRLQHITKNILRENLSYCDYKTLEDARTMCLSLLEFAVAIKSKKDESVTRKLKSYSAFNMMNDASVEVGTLPPARLSLMYAPLALRMHENVFYLWIWSILFDQSISFADENDKGYTLHENRVNKRQT